MTPSGHLVTLTTALLPQQPPQPEWAGLSKADLLSPNRKHTAEEKLTELVNLSGGLH